MTSVLPSWKLELIEKKRKRLEQEKAKDKEKEVRYSSLPDWKRSILSKRKGVQVFGEDPNVHNDDKASTDGSIQNDRIYGQNSGKKSQRSSVDDGRSLNAENNSSNSSESLANGNLAGQHSFVANSLSPSDKQKENVDQAVELSNSTQESSKTWDKEESRVSYEHVRAPSQLRRLYEVQVARENAQQEQPTKELPSRKRSNSWSLSDDKVCPHTNTTHTHHHETPTQKPESTDSKPNGTLPTNDNNTVIMPTQSKITISQEDSSEAPAALSEIKQQDAKVMDNHCSSKDKKEMQNDEELSQEIHVRAIRNKFGPSGFFRLRSISSDNLLKSSYVGTPSSSPKARPSPPNKRWSMVSLSRSNSTDDEGDHQPKSEHASLQRAKSMTDMRIENPPEPIHLRHRASVSHDIEHRIHELLHHVSDGNTDIEYDDDHIFSEVKTPESLSDSEVKEEPRKERRTSWSASEGTESAPNSILISLDENSLPSSNKELTDQKSHTKINEEGNEFAPQKPVSKLDHSVNQEEITIEKDDIHLQYSQLPDNQGTFKSDSENAPNAEALDDLPTKLGPSVHKLSALFGSSILKGNKKSKENKKCDNKSGNTKQPKQETKTDKKTNEPKENAKSRKFPWTKKANDNKKENNNYQKPEDTKFPFEGSQGLKPIQKKFVEHKIAGNMTLVIGANSDNYSKYKNNQIFNHLKTPASNSKISSAAQQNKTIPESPKKKQSTNIDYDDQHITIIDVPDTSSHDIEVSAIDIPAPPSPTPVSVIDMPEAHDSEVKVSVIDIPQDSDSDSDSGTSGSYDINPDVGSDIYAYGAVNCENIDGEEEEEDEDFDIGERTYVVPEVIFETEREQLKSCISSSLQKRKRKVKVAFHYEKLVKTHDYPSEQCLQEHFDEMQREKGGLAKYQPSALKNVNLSLESLKPNTQARNANANNEVTDHETKITYSDDGEGFSSSSGSTGALLF